MKLKENYVSVLMVVVAVGAGVLIFYFRDWRGWGGPVASPLNVKEITLSELAKEVPPELLIDENAVKIMKTVEPGQITVLFSSQLAPGDLMEKFIASLEAKGWRIGDHNKSEAIAQASAFSTSGIATFQSTKIDGPLSQVFIKYLKNR